MIFGSQMFVDVVLIATTATMSSHRIDTALNEVDGEFHTISNNRWRKKEGKNQVHNGKLLHQKNNVFKRN